MTRSLTSAETGTPGRTTIVATINAARAKHGIYTLKAPAHLRGAEPMNLTNRGKLAQGIQLEFSRGARSLLFPPDCSREARGQRSQRLRALARAIHTASKCSLRNSEPNPKVLHSASKIWATARRIAGLDVLQGLCAKTRFHPCRGCARLRAL